MLKACWDCLVGYDLMREGQRAEEPYSVQLNGNVSRAPPWPTPQLRNENMFVLPKLLGPEDKIIVNCETRNNPDELKIGLVTGSYSPDYNNLACQLEMSFPPNKDDKLAITIVQNGQVEVVYADQATNFYEGKKNTNFVMEFRVKSNRSIQVSVGSSYIHSFELMHSLDSIRFLTVNGDVNKVVGLDFQFG